MREWTGEKRDMKREMEIARIRGEKGREAIDMR